MLLKRNVSFHFNAVMPPLVRHATCPLLVNFPAFSSSVGYPFLFLTVPAAWIPLAFRYINMMNGVVEIFHQLHYDLASFSKVSSSLVIFASKEFHILTVAIE